MPKRKRYNLSVDSIHDSKIGIKYHLDDKLVDLLNNLDRRINWFKTLVNSIYGISPEHIEKLNSDWYKICPRCGNPYGASQFPSKDENNKDIYVCSNCNLIETVYKPLVEQLEDQNDRLIKERDDANLKLAEKNRIIKSKNETNLLLKSDVQMAVKIQNKHNQDKIELLEKLKKHYCKKMWDGRSSSDAWVIQECVDLIDKELANIRRIHESS